jgi:hypothetical protein
MRPSGRQAGKQCRHNELRQNPKGVPRGYSKGRRAEDEILPGTVQPRPIRCVGAAMNAVSGPQKVGGHVAQIVHYSVKVLQQISLSLPQPVAIGAAASILDATEAGP